MSSTAAKQDRDHVVGCLLDSAHEGPCQTGSSFLDETKASKLEQTVEAEDLTARLHAAGVEVAPDTSLAGLRELWATFGAGATAEDQRESAAGVLQMDDAPEGLKEAAADALARTTSEGENEGPTVGDLAERAAAAAGKTDPGTETLFPPADYDDPALALPAIDGYPIDRIAVQFSGEVMLDRGNKDHVALWKRLRLGREVELWVAAKGLGFTGKGATNRDGELDVIVGKRSVSIQTVRILAPEELDGAAREIAAQAREAAENEAAAEQASILEGDGDDDA